jgi:23S rRNA (cytidine1920-2'-O)/16S rRNA (cytidine1409-2'-O)-methyltransferase
LGKRARRRLRPLASELVRVRADIADPRTIIAAGEVLVDGRIVTNPASLVPVGASIVVRRRKPLRGEAKLAAALAAFRIEVRGVALDVGASAGGFTRVLLQAGAARVYAVDAGVGQLVGSLRADPRVVNLERTNLAEMHVPEPIDVVTIDVSYLSLAAAIPQLERVAFTPNAHLVALVKPMFELHAAAPPPHPERAVALANEAIERRWHPRACMRSPATAEFLLHAQRRA